MSIDDLEISDRQESQANVPKAHNKFVTSFKLKDYNAHVEVSDQHHFTNHHAASF